MGSPVRLHGSNQGDLGPEHTSDAQFDLQFPWLSATPRRPGTDTIERASAGPARLVQVLALLRRRRRLRSRCSGNVRPLHQARCARSSSAGLRSRARLRSTSGSGARAGGPSSSLDPDQSLADPGYVTVPGSQQTGAHAVRRTSGSATADATGISSARTSPNVPSSRDERIGLHGAKVAAGHNRAPVRANGIQSPGGLLLEAPPPVQVPRP